MDLLVLLLLLLLLRPHLRSDALGSDALSELRRLQQRRETAGSDHRIADALAKQALAAARLRIE